MLKNLRPVRFSSLLHLALSLILEAAEFLWCVHGRSCLYRFVRFPHGGKISNYMPQLAFHVFALQVANLKQGHRPCCCF